MYHTSLSYPTAFGQVHYLTPDKISGVVTSSARYHRKIYTQHKVWTREKEAKRRLSASTSKGLLGWTEVEYSTIKKARGIECRLCGGIGARSYGLYCVGFGLFVCSESCMEHCVPVD